MNAKTSLLAVMLAASAHSAQRVTWLIPPIPPQTDSPSMTWTGTAVKAGDQVTVTNATGDFDTIFVDSVEQMTAAPSGEGWVISIGYDPAIYGPGHYLTLFDLDCGLWQSTPGPFPDVTVIDCRYPM